MLIGSMAKRPGWQQPFGADRASAAADGQTGVVAAGYPSPIKQRRRRTAPVPAQAGGPGAPSYAARRWVVERTVSWLTKRRSRKLRWCKQAQNWLGLVQFACAHILCDLAIYG